MAITRIKSSGIYGSKSDSFLAGNTAYDPGATWLIASTTATAGQTSITFTNISSIYSSLQIRGMIQSNASTTGLTTQFLNVQFNSVTTTNYVSHYLVGDGSSASASGVTASNGIRVMATCMPNDAYYANMRSAVIIDIQDYTNTTRNKTLRYFSGMDSNLSSSNFGLALGSGFLTNSTSAITSITLVAPTGSGYTTGTKFSLYGMIG